MFNQNNPSQVSSSTENNSNQNRPAKMGFGAKVIALTLAVGIICQTVFPAVALYSRLITGEQYVTITTSFYEFGFAVLENGTQVLPSILSPVMR